MRYLWVEALEVTNISLFTLILWLQYICLKQQCQEDKSHKKKFLYKKQRIDPTKRRLAAVEQSLPP
jgi:hypothetical protein